MTMEVAAVYIRSIMAIASSRPHCDHLSLKEWTDLVNFIVELQTDIPADQELSYLKTSTDLWRSLAKLLQAREAVDSAMFEHILRCAEDFPFKLKETSAHLPMFSCLRQIYYMSLFEDSSVCELAQALAMEILLLGRVRNNELRQEIVLLCAMIKDKYLESLTVTHALALVENCVDMMIDTNEVEFVSSNKLSWLEHRSFRAKSFANIHPFIASTAAANVLSVIAQTSQDQDRPTKRVRTLNDKIQVAFEYLPNISVQILCFDDTLELNEFDCEYMISQLGQQHDFWIFLLLANSLDTICHTGLLLKLWGHCLENLRHNSSSAAAFCLSKLIDKLVGLARPDFDIAHMFQTLIWQLDSALVLSSGSILLFKALFQLNILDQEYQRLKVSRLQIWFVAQWKKALENGGIYTNSDIYQCISGTNIVPVYTGFLGQVHEQDIVPFLESFNRLSHSTTVHSRKESAMSQEHNRPYSHQLFDELLESVNPERSSKLLWVFASSLTTSEALKSRLTDMSLPEGELFRSDIEALLVFLRATSNFEKQIVAEAIWSMFKPSQASLIRWTSDVNLGQLLKQFLRNLGFSFVNDELIMSHGFDMDMKAIAEDMFSNYDEQRSWTSLAGLLDDMNLVNVPKSDWMRLYMYLLNVIKSQSKFSRLRPRFASSICHLSDWGSFFATSSSITVLNSSSQLTYDDDIVASGELGGVFEQLSEHRYDIQACVLLNFAYNGFDIGILIVAALRLPLDIANNIVSEIAANAGVRPLLLFQIHGPKILTGWTAENDLKEFPIHIFEIVEMAPFLDMVPLMHVDSTWVMDPRAFPTYYILATTDEKLQAVLMRGYGTNYSTNELAFEKSIQLLKITLVAIGDDSKDWEDLPDPTHPNVGLPMIQSLQLDDSVGEWMVEKLLRNKAHLCTNGDKYLAIRQSWIVYKFTENPEKTRVAFLRAAVFLLEGSYNKLVPVIERLLKLLLEKCNPEVIAELSCLLLSKRLLIEHIEPVLSRQTDPLCQAVLMFQSVNAIPEHLDVILLQIEKTTFPRAFAEYFYHRFSKIINARGEIPNALRGFNISALSSPILNWCSEFDILHGKFAGWFGQLLALEKITNKSTDSNALSVLERLQNISRQKGFDIFRHILPFLRRSKHLFPESEVLFPGVGEEYDPQILWEGPDFESQNLKSNCVTSFSIALFNYALGFYDVPLSLDSAFREADTLAIQLLPALIQDIVTNHKFSNERKFADLKSIFNERLINGSSEVKRVLLDVVARVYQTGDALVEHKSIHNAAEQLGFSEMALMFLELEWSHTKNSAGVYYNALRSICDGLEDADIKSGTNFVTIRSAISNMGVLRQLNYDLTAYEIQGRGSESIELSKSLKSVGLYRASELLQRSNLFDYDPAWKLQLWDLPEACDPKGSIEILFKLFKPSVMNFVDAYADAFKLSDDHERNNLLLTIRNIETLPNSNLPSLFDTDLRLARELYLYRRSDNSDLIKELSSTCSKFLDVGDNDAALSYALKLDNVVSNTDAGDLINIKAVLLSQIKSAQVSWALGNQSVSLEILKRVVNNDTFLNSQERNEYFSVAETFSLMADWSAKAMSDTDQVIIQGYLQPAENYAQESSSLSTKEHVFHIFGQFCDKRYNDSELEARIEDSREMRDAKGEYLKNLKDAASLPNLKAGDKQSLSRKIEKEQKLFDSEDAEYDRLVEQRAQFLQKSIEMYLKSISCGDRHSVHDSTRFIALWLQHASDVRVNKVVSSLSHEVPSSQFIPWANQLTSRLSVDGSLFQKELWKIITKMVTDHPLHVLWHIFALRMIVSNTNDPSALERAEAGNRMWKAVKRMPRPGEKVITTLGQLGRMIVELAHIQVPSSEKNGFGFNRLSTASRKWWTKTLPELGINVPTDSIVTRRDANYNNVPTIAAVDQKMQIASGLSAPKILKFTRSDGLKSTMLIKGGNDDLRQDAIMEQVFEHANEFLVRDRRAQTRSLNVRTYNVIPIGPTAGAIEFVRNTKSLMDILEPLHRSHDGKQWALDRAREFLRKAQKGDRIVAFKDLEIHVKPVLRLFFFESFKDSKEWLEKRTRYSRSTAVASVVGYILGLGDRHCNNILLDSKSGEVVHIDLGISFDNGRFLRIPETVPFRLTRDIVDGMGVCGVTGVFNRCAEIVLDLLRDKRDGILTVLDVLRYDPLYSWTVSPIRGLNAQRGSEDPSFPGISRKPATVPRSQGAEADRALLGVRRKLSPELSSEATIRELVQQATSETNLAQLFEGWCPFY